MHIETEDDLMRREDGRRLDLDVAALGRTIARRKFWVLAPVLVCLVGSVIGVNLVKPRYTAEAKILIENQESYFTRPDRTDVQPPPLPDDEAVQSQVQLVSSRDIARDAIKVLDLEGNPEFDPLADGVGPVTRLLVLLGLAPDPLRVAPEDRILTSYYDKLNVYPVVRSRVLNVQFTAQNPDLAAKAANTISNLYIEMQSSTKRDSARAAATSLASLIADLKVRAAAAETKAQEYRAANGLLIGTNNTTITAQQLTDISTQLAQARTAEADSQAKAKLLKDMIRANRISEVPDVANNDLIRRISDQRITLKAQIAQQSMTLLPGHPRMQELNAQLGDIDNQLRAAGEKTVRTLENDAHIAAGRVEYLTAALDAQKKTATAAGADEVNLRDLELQARLLKDQLEFNTQKYQEAVVRQDANSTPADARLISRAVSPETPSFPKKGPMIAIFTLAGLIMSIGIIVSRELLSGRAFSSEVAPTRAAMPMPMPVATQPPPATVDPEPVPVWAAPAPVPAAAAPEPIPERVAGVELETVIDAIRSHRNPMGAVRILVASAGPDLAAAPAALDIARTLAKQDRVILVDCGEEPGDLDALIANRDPDFADGPAPGLRNLLAGETTFAEVIHRDPSSRLHLVPLGTGPFGQNSKSFDMVIDALAGTYDHVVLAVPTPGRSGASVLGANRADIAVLVLTPEQPDSDADACQAALHDAGVSDVLVLDALSFDEPISDARSAA